MKISNKTLRVGIPAHWGASVPPLQHSYYGAVVLDNQFEPLVRYGKSGLIEPLGAISWEISQDHRIIRFKIDTSRRFSDGSKLSAADFKRSWEDGLRMLPKSKNLSVVDALFTIKGFTDFYKKGTIEGVRALGDDVLEIEFERPVRTALEYLGGVRYSAYKLVDGHPVGTGPYTMKERNGTLILIPNQYYTGKETRFKEIKIIVTPPETMSQKLKLGIIQAALVAEVAGIQECGEGAVDNIRCAFGQEAAHIAVHVNGLAGRIFSNRNHRLALQTLIHKQLQDFGPTRELKARRIAYDPQSLLHFQPGRLSDSETDKLIRQGEEYIPKLVEASRKNPIYLVYSRWEGQWLISMLDRAGILIAERSGKVEFSRSVEMLYKTHEPDLMYAGFSVYNGDPDGLYHKLGKNGAIFSPMEERNSVRDLMDTGRAIMDRDQLTPHYQKVARAILEEVPYVHVGYSYKTVAYNSDKVRITESFINRNNYRVTIFEPR